MIVYKKRGVALLWSLVLSSVLLIISSTMVSYIIKESRFSINIEDSSKAYGAAKSGIEWGIYQIEEKTSIYSIALDLINTGDGIRETNVDIYVVEYDSNANPIEFEIRSDSSHNQVNRSIEYIYKKESPSPVTLPTAGKDALINSTSVGTNYNSFELSFDFWGNHWVMFGLNNADSDSLNDRYIAMKINQDINGDGVRDDTITLEARGRDISGTFRTRRSSPVGIYALYPDAQRQEPYRHRGVIKYIENTAASLTIYQTDPATGTETCVGTGSINLNGYDMGNLYSLFFIDDPDSQIAAETRATHRTGQRYINMPTTGADRGHGDGDIVLVRPYDPVTGVDHPAHGDNSIDAYWFVLDNIIFKN